MLELDQYYVKGIYIINNGYIVNYFQVNFDLIEIINIL